MNSKDRRNDKRLKKKYGISLATRNRWDDEQNNVCWICKRPPKRLALCVDHNHNTGKVRRLLCFTCNKRIIGAIERFKIPVRRIIKYFELFDPTNVVLQSNIVRPVRKSRKKKRA